MASADLAHVGIRFGDPEPPDLTTLQALADQDRHMLAPLRDLDPEGFFEFLRRERDRRKICGSSAIYTLMHLIAARRGELLKYDQSVEPNSQAVVTFASMAFYGAEGEREEGKPGGI
jgi:AmmeMemoRadiSam system protein B